MDDGLRHFLLAFNHATNELLVQEDFGQDVDRAAEAYTELERKYRDNLAMDIVLIGSDSIETVKVTHSTYFPVENREAAIRRILNLSR